jgi:hypothetical protein
MSTFPEIGSNEWYDWMATILFCLIITLTPPVLMIIYKIKDYRARKNKKAQ